MDNQNQLCNFDVITLKQNNMTTLKIGDKAPNFESVDEKGNTVKLSDYTGKKLVLFFYPKASTPGCTAEACDLRDNYKTFLAKGYDVLGVSADSARRQQNFINKNELPFPLLADESKDVINAFGVWGPKKFMGREYDGIHRTTFVIDEKGVIEDVITKVKTKEHANQILK
ncbi:peroxiredoxin [Tenacibaculum sp. KUL113]|nr:peroxiredoxin [Tenacibaculum sp. KUL113]